MIVPGSGFVHIAPLVSLAVIVSVLGLGVVASLVFKKGEEGELPPDEITAVSQWLSAQTLPMGVKPAPPSAQALPLPCGSAQ